MPEFKEWAGLIAPFINSLGILFLGFWINARAASRKALIEQVDKKMEQVDQKVEKITKQIANGNEECREDIRAIVVQVSAFQREVAERYPLRQQVESALNGLREDMRFYLNRGQEPKNDPPRRR